MSYASKKRRRTHMHAVNEQHLAAHAEPFDPLLPLQRMIVGSLVGRPPDDEFEARRRQHRQESLDAGGGAQDEWFDWVERALHLVRTRPPFLLTLARHAQWPDRSAWYLLAPKDSPIRVELATDWLQLAELAECDEWQTAVQVAMSFEYAPLTLDDEKARAIAELERIGAMT
jgi:hypothetical protein